MNHPFTDFVAQKGFNTTLADVRRFFPKASGNSAVSGRIPMSVFEENELVLRNIFKTDRLRAIYRGPRKSNRGRSSAMTRRCDAEAVLLYVCGDKGWKDRRKAKLANGN